ncbi:mechanosensitive ion channel family protein [Leptothermofonsia sp. ETS-13]|uniref:mechanosensitive ion channel family protein n=1 Tax=Leptothermofonsia sp. ETS-13 TaxID=3035696 RepID=UPI003B9FB061
MSKRFTGDRPRRFHPLISFVLVSLLTFAMVVGWIPAAVGQLPIPSPTNLTSSNPPAGVERYGAIEVATVNFNGEPLFKVASPTVRDRSNPGNLIPVEERVDEIEANLSRVIEDDVSLSHRGIRAKTNYDLETLQVYASTLNNENVIFVKDKNHPEPLNILTVTQSDAAFYGQPIDEVTEFMQQKISTSLREALKERTRTTLDEQLRRALPIFLGMVIVSLLVFLLQQFLNRRERALREREAAEAAQTGSPPGQTTGKPASEARQLSFQSALRRQFTLKRRRSFVAFLKWLAFWAQLTVWVGGTGLILALFPWTRPLSVQILSIPLNLLLVWFVTGLLIRIGDIALDYLGKFWDESDLFSNGDDHREALRISTTVGALKGLKTFLVYIIGITWALRVFGFPVGSVLAIGGIIAFAISLGFQNVVRDVVNGFLILMEDQYAVGDVVSIGNDSGLVENMNLRITQLRDGEGRLITIPNSAITQVRNLTRTWSRVDFSIEVAYDTDINHALDVIRKVTEQMHNEPEWRDRMIDSPEVLGVDSISHVGMLIRVWIKTKPGQQWAVGREFRRRIRLAFDENGIAIGKPQQDSWVRGDSASNSGSANGREVEETASEDGSKR